MTMAYAEVISDIHNQWITMMRKCSLKYHSKLGISIYIIIYMSNLENPRFTERTSIHTFSNMLGTDVFLWIHARILAWSPQISNFNHISSWNPPFLQLPQGFSSWNPHFLQLFQVSSPVLQLFQLKSPIFTVDICWSSTPFAPAS